MKQCFLLVILGIFFSCNKVDSFPTVDQEGRKIFYNEDDYCKSVDKSENIVIVDTACINAKQRALSDIKANRLTYYYKTIGPHEKEFRAELKKLNITAVHGNLPTCLKVGRFGHNCYEKEMAEEVYRRYGDKFFDSIWNKTLLARMEKFPNDSLVESGKVLKWKEVYKSLLR